MAQQAMHANTMCCRASIQPLISRTPIQLARSCPERLWSEGSWSTHRYTLPLLV
jgi:hypothetical protein